MNKITNEQVKEDIKFISNLDVINEYARWLKIEEFNQFGNITQYISNQDNRIKELEEENLKVQTQSFNVAYALKERIQEHRIDKSKLDKIKEVYDEMMIDVNNEDDIHYSDVEDLGKALKIL